MAFDFGLLRTIHGMLKQVTDIRDRMERGPRKMKLAQANEARFLIAWQEAKDLAIKTRMAVDSKQMQLSEREAKIADFKIRLNTCDSNKEFQLIKERIAADLQANSVLQDEILEMLERLDVLTADVEAAKNNHAKSKSEAAKVVADIEQELQALGSELTRVTTSLETTEKQLPSDLRGEYRRKVKGLGENVLGETDSETCGNCCQRLTTQMAADLMMKRPVYCQGCGCLLYVSANHPAGL